MRCGTDYSNNLTFDKDSIPAEDIIFNYKVFLREPNFVILNKAYYHYIKRDVNSTVTRYYRKLPDISHKRYKSFEDTFSHYEMNNSIYIDWLNRAYINEKLDVFLNLFRNGCNLSKEKKLRYIEQYILNDTKLEKLTLTVNSGIFYENIFKKLYLTKNSKVLLNSFNILFWLRRRFKRIYILYRNRGLN